MFKTKKSAFITFLKAISTFVIISFFSVLTINTLSIILNILLTN